MEQDGSQVPSQSSRIKDILGKKDLKKKETKEGPRRAGHRNNNWGRKRRKKKL